MPISDEVIELAPVKKTKTQLIILLAIIGVCVGLAVTFLVLYLLKPNVDENPIVVNAVTLTGNDLYSESDQYYAAIGNEYTVYANISVEKSTSTMLRWEVIPAGSVTMVSSTDTPSVIEETGEEGVYFKFIPTGSHNTDVTIKVRSAADVNKSAEFNFKIVNAAVHSIVPKQYYATGSTAIDITGSSISIPYYTTNIRNNKTYYMTFEQFGRYNDLTGKYLDMTVVGSGDQASNMISVSSSDPQIVSVQYPTANAFSFKAEGKTGSAVITITANVNNPPSSSDAPESPVTYQIKVNVADNVTLGYIENIYFFDKGVVNSAFVESVLDNTRTKIDPSKLDDVVEDAGLQMNEEFVMPYGSTYENIFSHILVSPISIQYDLEKRVFLTEWHKKIKMSATGDALHVSTNVNNGEVTLRADGLASTAKDATVCKMTLTDGTAGSLNASVTVDVNIIAQNKTGNVGVKAGSSTFAEGQSVPVSPGDDVTFTVAYAHAMPGKTDLATVLEMNYLNTGFMLEFETNNLEVHIAGINDALVPGDVYNFTKNAMSIEAQGTETSSLRNFVTTVTFSVKIKAGASDGPCELRFIKVGSLATDSTDWADDCTWNKSMTFAVTRRAEHAYFKEDALATAIITNNGQRAGKFEVNAKRQDATIYVQNLAFDQRFDSLFSVLDLVTADASFTAAVTKISLPTGSVFLRISDNPNNAEYNKLKFRGVACSATVAQALAEITVYAAGGKPLNEGLTVSVYVIDAAKSFATIQSGAVRYYGNNPTNSSATISPYDVKIVRQFAENPTMYEFESDDVHLYLGHSTDPSAELHPETRSGAIYFSHGEREIFSYSLSSGALTPLVDLYTYAYNYNQSHDTAPINVSSVLFEIKVGADEFYIGDPPSLKVSCLFERYADGLAIFTDEACTNKISGSYAVNQGELVHLYVSSTVTIQDEEIIVNNFPGVTTVQRSFIVINSQDTALLNNVTLSSSALVDGEENQFYYVTFHAPRVSGTGNTNDYVLSLQGGDSASLMLTVQNFARGVSRISLCNDQDGATAIDDAVLNFGGFINGDIFERTIYIKVEYVTANSTYMYYDSVVLTLPKYLKVLPDLSDSNISPSTENDGNGNLGVTTYIITPTSSNEDVKTNNAAKIFKCVLILEQTAEEMEGEIRLVSKLATESAVEYTKNIYIGTGLASVEVSKDGEHYDTAASAQSTAVVFHTFALKDKADSENDELTLSLNFIALTKSKGYQGITYNPKYFVLADSGKPTVSGFEFYTDDISSETPNIKVRIDKSNVQVVTNATCTLIFRSMANGANTSTFKIELHLTVTMDIFAISFGNGENDFNFATDGTDSVMAGVPVSIRYNGYTGEAGSAQPTDVQPIDEFKNKVGVSVVKQVNGVDNDYDGKDVYLVKSETAGVATYTLYVRNDTLTVEGLFVRIKYGNLVERRAIVVRTKSHSIELDRDNSTVTVSGVSDEKTANIEIKASSDTYKLTIKVINNGTNKPIDSLGTGQAVSYGIYKTKDNFTDGNKSTELTVDSDGVIRIGTPSAVSGTVYYRALYTYSDGSFSEEKSICVAITYKIAVNGIAIDKPGDSSDTWTWDGQKFTVYYKDAKNYTTLDIAKYITVSNAFGRTYSDKLSIALESLATDFFVIDSANKTLIIPKDATGSEGKLFEINVSYDGTTVYTKQFTVVVVVVGKLTLQEDSGDISVFTDNSLTVTPVFDTFDGLTATYSLTALPSSNLKISGEGNEKTVALNSRQDARFGTATLTAIVAYSLKDGSSLTLEGNYWSFTTTYTVNIGGTEYTPSFTVKAGEDTVEGGVKHTIDSKKKYTLTVEQVPGNPTDVAYVALAETVVTFKDVKDAGSDGPDTNVKNVKDISFKANESGPVEIKVTVTAYGQTFEKTVSYTFAYGGDATAALYKGSTETTVSNGATEKLTYTDNNQAPTYEYRIKDLGEGVATFVVSGITGDLGNVDESRKASGIISITVYKPTTLTVRGTVAINNRTIYLDSYTVTFTAEEPEFTLTSGAQEIVAGGKTTFGVQNTTGLTITTKYYVDGGGAVIDADSGELTANSDLTADREVTVRAVVTVGSGPFKGTAYTYYHSIKVLGVPLPTIGWKQAEKVVKITDELTLSELYTSTTQNVSVGTNNAKTITYTLSARVAEPTEGDLVNDSSNTYYKISGGKLTFMDTAKTRAGGTITLTISATIQSSTDNINIDKAATVTQETLTIIITPQAYSDGVSIANAAGTYDLSTAATVYSTSESGHFVSSAVASASKVVALELGTGVDSSKFYVSGSNLILKDNVISSTDVSVSLTATVKIVGGAYGDTMVTCPVNVTVKVPSAIDTANITWNSGKYDTVSVKDNIQLPGEEKGGNISKISVSANNFGEYVGVEANNTANPIVSIDKDCNTYIAGETSSSAADKTITLTYTVTHTDGKKYVVEQTLSVKAIAIAVSTTLDGVPLTQDEGDSGYTINTVEGESFVLVYAANKSDELSVNFDVTVTNVEITDGATSPATSTALSSTYAVNRVIVSAISAASAHKVSVTYVVAGNPKTVIYTVNVAALTSGTAYAVTEGTTNNKVAINTGNGNQEVATTWTLQNRSAYSYPASIIFTAPGRLSDYVSAIKITDTNGSNPKTAGSLSNNSVTINFNTGSTRTTRNDFKVVITYKTGSAQAQSFVISAQLTAYNNRIGGSSTNVSVNYRFQVVDNMTVTFNINGGESSNFVDTAEKTVTYGSTYSNLPKESSSPRFGYVFDGWFTDEHGGTRVYDGTEGSEPATEVTATVNHTLYAHWSAKSVTVNYVAEDATLNPSALSKQVAYDDAYGLLPAATKAGYAFIGWYTAEAGSGRKIEETTSVNQANGVQESGGSLQVTLYAYFMTKHVIVYYYDGDKLVAMKDGVIGEKYVLDGVDKYGYDFVGWHLSSDLGDSALTSETATISDDGEHKLYGEWSAKSVSVTFNANGGSLSVDGTIVQEFDDEYKLPTTEPTRDGYTFAGWWTTKDDTGEQITSADTVAKAEAHTLYAHWTGKQVTVTFELQSGNMENNNPIVSSFGEKYNLPQTQPTRDNYTFAGWWTTSDNSGVQVTENTIVTNDQAHTLYAHWTGNTVSVTFDLQEGNLEGNQPISSRFGEKYNLPATNPTREHYVFAGWWTNSSNGSQITADTIVSDLSIVTLYARWTPEEYTVTLYLNEDGDGGTEIISVKVKYNGTFSLHKSFKPTRENYVFVGWYDDPTATTKQYDDDETVTGNIEMYAHWTNQVQVTFMLEGGKIGDSEGESVTTTCTLGENYTLPQNPTRDGDYEFDGWYTLPNGKGTKIEPDSTIFTNASAITLYAHWTSIQA